MKRAIWIAGNWKMNHGQAETQEFFEELAKTQKSLPDDVKALIFPSFLSLQKAIDGLSQLNFPLQIGAQNGSAFESGAYTGEISGSMLKELGVSWVLIGHSERRKLFLESDADIQARAQELLKQGLGVCLCIGETQLDRDSNEMEFVLRQQLEQGLPYSQIANAWKDRFIIAYEPVWAIGTGVTASPDQAQEAHTYIRYELERILGKEAATHLPILYGGSVSPKNLVDLLKRPHIDGALIGGASLKADSYGKLLSLAVEAKV